MAYILHNHITLMKIGEVTCSSRKRFVMHSDPDDFSQFSNSTFEVFTANNTPTGLTKCGYKRSNQQLLCWLLLLWSPGHDLCFHTSFKVEIIGYFRGCTVLQAIFSVFLASCLSQKLLKLSYQHYILDILLSLAFTLKISLYKISRPKYRKL